MKITFFTIPKPFEGHIGIIQKNAIQSWCNLTPKPDIILFGDEKGVKEVAEEFGITHYPGIRKNENGTPYINDIFKKVTWLATTQVLCYSNCDDIFFPFLLKAIDGIPEMVRQQFLMLGERRNVDIVNRVDTSDPDIEWSITQNFKLQQFPGIDYFIFSRGMLQDMPDFLVGRAGWDNWVIYHCRKNRIPVIDASKIIFAAHQNHDYAHVPQKTSDTWKGSKESQDNLKLVKNRYIYLWELADADYIYRFIGLYQKDFTYRDILQWIVLNTPEWMHWLIEPVFRAGHIARWAYINIRDKVGGEKWRM